MAAVVAAVMSHGDDVGPPNHGSKARAEKRAQEEKKAAQLMSMVGNVYEVQKVRKKNNQVWDTSTEHGRQQAAASRIQFFARCWRNRNIKCHRENLGLRLVFEQDLKLGVARLVTQVCDSASVPNPAQHLMRALGSGRGFEGAWPDHESSRQLDIAGGLWGSGRPH